MEEEIGDEGLEAVARIEIAGRRPHEEVAPPQGTQIHADTPMHVDEQGALSFLLQHRLRFFRGETEVAHLLLEIGAMRLGAPQRPAPQAAEREHTEQLVEVFKHRPQAACGLAEQDVEQLQVGTEQLGITKTLGRRWRRGNDQFDHRTRGTRGELQTLLGKIGNNILADLTGHGRQMLNPGGDDVAAAPHAH